MCVCGYIVSSKSPKSLHLVLFLGFLDPSMYHRLIILIVLLFFSFSTSNHEVFIQFFFFF